MTTTMSSIDNAYYWKNFSMKGHFCKTNIPSCTAFRGFGAPQGIAIMEDIIDAMAATLKLPPEQVGDSECLYRQYYKWRKLQILYSVVDEVHYKLHMIMI